MHIQVTLTRSVWLPSSEISFKFKITICITRRKSIYILNVHTNLISISPQFAQVVMLWCVLMYHNFHIKTINVNNNGTLNVCLIASTTCASLLSSTAFSMQLLKNNFRWENIHEWIGRTAFYRIINVKSEGRATRCAQRTSAFKLSTRVLICSTSSSIGYAALTII